MSGQYLQPVSDTHLDGRWLALARGAWIVVVALSVILFVVSVPAQFAFLTTPCSSNQCDQNLQLTVGQVQELERLGLSIGLYASYFIAVTLLSGLVFLAVAAVIFWRKSDDRLALFCAFMLVLFGAGSPSNGVMPFPLLNWLALLLQALGNSSIVLFFFLFPDGRFVPRWTRWLALLAITREILGVYAPNDLINTLFFAAVLLILSLQVYRYRRVSNSVQRQQTKWVVLGATVGIGGYAGLIAWLVFMLPQGQPPNVLTQMIVTALIELFLLLVPLSIGMAVLRSHLWDVDILIRRTLIYGALTALLALVYFGSVVLLQQLFYALTKAQQSEIVTIISTLGIAALFAPLRRRVQEAIDHRFYRRKYDAQQVLARFAATARDEVELERLTGELVQVVGEVMQPVHVSLWLNPSDRASRTAENKK